MGDDYYADVCHFYDIQELSFSLKSARTHFFGRCYLCYDVCCYAFFAEMDDSYQSFQQIP